MATAANHRRIHRTPLYAAQVTDTSDEGVPAVEPTVTDERLIGDDPGPTGPGAVRIDASRYTTADVQQLISDTLRDGLAAGLGDADPTYEPSVIHHIRSSVYADDLDAMIDVMRHSLAFGIASHGVVNPDITTFGNQADGIPLYDGRTVKLTMTVEVSKT